ncbi:hypothetical protein SANTM175S_03565 [Streptomyces antimycoticus]
MDAPVGEVPAGGEGLGADAVDARFWEAVEREDLEALVRTLEVDDEEQQSSLTALLPALSSWRRQWRERSTVDGWRYSVVWKSVESAAEATLTGTWLVAVPKVCGDDASWSPPWWMGWPGAARMWCAWSSTQADGR